MTLVSISLSFEKPSNYHMPPKQCTGSSNTKTRSPRAACALRTTMHCVNKSCFVTAIVFRRLCHQTAVQLHSQLRGIPNHLQSHLAPNFLLSLRHRLDYNQEQFVILANKVMVNTLKRRFSGDHDGSLQAKKVKNEVIIDEPPPAVGTSATSNGPLAGFPMFPLLPMELKLQIIEEAMAALDQPRIVLLDTKMVPCFDPVTRGITSGWELTISNRVQVQQENPFELARSLLHIGPSGESVAEPFLDEHTVWHPARYCPELKDGLDLSLSTDIFCLPNDLYKFFSVRSLTPACRSVQGDEGRIRRLMISFEAFEKALRWRACRFDDDDEESNGGTVDLIDLRSVLDTIVWHYWQCEELIIVVDEIPGSSGCKYFTWDKLHYVPAGAGTKPVLDPQCQAVREEFDELIESEALQWPGLSFVFTRKSADKEGPATSSSTS